MLGKPKSTYLSQNDIKIEEMKKELLIKSNEIAENKIAKDDLIKLCNNLSDVIQGHASELLDLYYSRFSSIGSRQNETCNYQRPSINIYMISSTQPPQNNIQFVNPMLPMPNPSMTPINSYLSQPIQAFSPYPNASIPVSNPIFQASLQPQFQQPNMINLLALPKDPSKPRKSNKKKSKKSKSKSEKRDKSKKKEKSKKDKRSNPSSKSKSSSKSSQSTPAAPPPSGTIKSFPYQQPIQSGFGQSRRSQFVSGILSFLNRSPGPFGSNSQNGPVIVDSSSKFVTGYGYPRNVMPGGSYFQAADDDEDFWIRFDFKEKSIKITNYYIDSDNIKNWELQISDDGIEWETIDSHSNYQTQNLKEKFDVSNGRFAQYCRIHQTGEIWQGSKRTLKLNTIEFYGEINTP